MIRNTEVDLLEQDLQLQPRVKDLFQEVMAATQTDIFVYSNDGASVLPAYVVVDHAGDVYLEVHGAYESVHRAKTQLLSGLDVLLVRDVILHFRILLHGMLGIYSTDPIRWHSSFPSTSGFQRLQGVTTPPFDVS